jgi:hypothetical protein
MRCRHCKAPLIAVPLGTSYTGSCSCGAQFYIELTEVTGPTMKPEALDNVRRYHTPGSY